LSCANGAQEIVGGVANALRRLKPCGFDRLRVKGDCEHWPEAMASGDRQSKVVLRMDRLCNPGGR